MTWYLQRSGRGPGHAAGRWRLGPLYEQASDVGAGCGSPARALEWLESHLPGLLAAVQAAHDEQLHPQVWQLCEAMWGMLLFRKHYTAWLASHQTGLQSARACADDQAEAQMNIQLGAAHRSLRRSMQPWGISPGRLSCSGWLGTGSARPLRWTNSV